MFGPNPLGIRSGLCNMQLQYNHTAHTSSHRECSKPELNLIDRLAACQVSRGKKDNRVTRRPAARHNKHVPAPANPPGAPRDPMLCPASLLCDHPLRSLSIIGLLLGAVNQCAPLFYLLAL